MQFLKIDNKLSKLRGKLLLNECLSSYTSWQVGGPVDRLYKPTDRDDLALFLSILPPKEPVIFLGAATNVLVRDKGIRGTVVLLKNALHSIQTLSQNDQLTLLRVEAGVLSSKLACYTAELDLCGLEFLSGIPGTIGGALAMNAGAHGGNIWNTVTAVETMNRLGERNIRRPKDFEIGYRSVTPIFASNEIFIAGHFKLLKGNKGIALANIKEMLDKRRDSQPLNLPSAGSIFRNPKDCFAAKLIQDCSLKGFRIGGVSVSDKHANFIVNDRHGKAEDIEKLIIHIINVVEQRKGVRLVPEIKILGEH